MNRVKTFFQKIQKPFKKDPFLLFVIFFCTLFFVLSSALPYIQSKNNFVKFFSPDEGANYVFTKLYKETGDFYIFEKYNLLADEIVRPRSYFSSQGFLKPVSFLGIIIIYGSIAGFLGLGVIPFLTPFFASLGLFFYYLLIKRLFGDRNAFVSFLIFFSFPVLLYYSARSMFHNVLFSSFFIMAAYFFITLIDSFSARIKNEEVKKYYRRLFSFDFLYSALAGLFIGLAIAVRASELTWIAPAGFVLLILKWKRLSFFRLSIFFSFVFLALLPIFYYNQGLYGSPFYGGYYEMNKSIEEIGQAGSSAFKSLFHGYFSDIRQSVKIIFNTVFYFGFHPRQSFEMFNKYCIEMFWYIFWPAIAGFTYMISYKKRLLRKVWKYGVSWLVLSLILVLYYGSWKFVDNPDPSRFTIGNSYTRYWIPVYIGIIPLASIFILNIPKFLKIFKNSFLYKKLGILISSVLLVLIMILSFNYVYQGSEEGLVHYPGKLNLAQEEFNKVMAMTERNSLIITEYHDKFFFPERKVVVGRFNDNNMNRNYYSLVKHIPVYYYNFTFSEEDIKYLNERRLREFGLNIELVDNINDVFSLYRLHEFKQNDISED
jgi:hypothetical protein